MVNDEFYTPSETIINELKYYGYDGLFRNKTIYLPCDYDATLPYIEKKIKKVTNLLGNLKIEMTKNITIYKVIPELFNKQEANNIRNCQFISYLTEHKEEFGIKDIFISGYDVATGNGLKFQDAPFQLFDVIITNPPFSQMQEWIKKIIEFGKLRRERERERERGYFLFLAPLSILTTTFAFPHFKNQDFWCGYTEPNKFEDHDGKKIKSYLPTVWLTNLDVKKHKKERTLSKSWKDHPDEYMPYWNFRAIEVPSIQDIPYDYYDVIGVPATFLKDIHPDQFEIIGLGVGKQQFMALNGFIDRSSYPRKKFQEFYIKKGDPENRYNERNSELFTSLDGENPYKRPFARILIKNKKIIKNENSYGFEDVIKWLKQELLNKKPVNIWDYKLFTKKRSNQKLRRNKK